MSILRIVLLGLLALALGGVWLVAAMANFGHGLQFAGNSPYAPVFGLASVAADVIKAAVFLGCAVAWRKKLRFRALCCLVVWLPVTAWSIVSCMGFAATILSDTTAGRTLHAVADKSLTRQIDDQVAQIVILQAHKLKTHTSQWERIDAEITKAEARLDRLRATARSTSTVGSAHPASAMLARFIDPENFKTGQVLIFLLMVEIASNLGLLAFAPMFGRDAAEAAEQMMANKPTKTPPPQGVGRRKRKGRTTIPPMAQRDQAMALVAHLESAHGVGATLGSDQVFQTYYAMAKERRWGTPMDSKRLGLQLKLLGITKDDEGHKLLYILPTERERLQA